MNTCTIRCSRHHFNLLMGHLFPGDGDEHGSVLLAGVNTYGGRLILNVREVHLAREGVEYVQGKIGYRALTPQYIHKLITRARDERLAYLAVHNHGAATSVGFSHVDIRSHETGYPALLQIAKGMPVGALVSGLHSLQADIWLPSGSRLSLDHAVVVGNSIDTLYAAPRHSSARSDDTYDRQVRMFGKSGQARLSSCCVGIIGLGGVGSLVAEYLGRLGVGAFVLIDDDRVEASNLSRIVGATKEDAARSTPKVDIASRLILQANPSASIKSLQADVSKESAARVLLGCDYLFLAADSMRARLVVNAIVNQYLIPGVQMGSKISSDKKGNLSEVLSVNRPLRPGNGCLWCNGFIDPNQLAREAKSDKERRDQAYGIEEANPSVISMNAMSASSAVNDFLLDYLSLRVDNNEKYFQHTHHLRRHVAMVKPRIDSSCSECSYTGSRFARGDTVPLPCIEG